MTLALLWSLLVAAVTAYCAKKQGKNPLLWFGLAYFFGLFALMLLTALPFLKKVLLYSIMKKYGFQKQPYKKTEEPGTVTLEVEPTIHLKTTPESMKKLWYFLDGDRQTIGPMSFEAFHQRWKNGTIFSETLIWNETFPEWKQFKEIFPSKD